MTAGEPVPASLIVSSKTLCIMLTYACTASCKNCGTLSSPRDKNNLPLETALEAIDQAVALNFCNVVFTGGEATLRWDDLLVAIGHANRLALPTRLVTNAHWAISGDLASRSMQELIDAGLDEINFSTGDQHVRYVPLERVVHATCAALDLGLRVHTMIELTSERTITESDYLRHPLMELLPEERKRQLTTTESPWMPLNPGHIDTYPEGMTRNSENILASVGCDSVLQTYVVQADKRIGSCCGLGMRKTPELNVGRAEGDGFLASSIKEAEEDFLKLWLRFKGPERILAWAAGHDPSIAWEHKYAHCCQACMRIYEDPKVQNVIESHYAEIVPEVMQLAWLNEHYIPEKMSQQR